MNYAFGRKKHDPAALAAAPKHKFGANPPPPSVDRTKWDFPLELGYNDTTPCCTSVGLWNAGKGIASLNGWQPALQVPMILSFYAQSIGLPANTPQAQLETTDGAVMLDVLNYQGAHGFDVGEQTPWVARFGIVALNTTSLAWAMARLGPVYVGAMLYQSDMDATVAGQPWDAAPGVDPGPAVGRHCFILWDYLGLGALGKVRCGTWGAWQVCTWRWVLARLEEAYGPVYRQLVRSDDYYLGLTADGLVSEL
jgi:hypothetical protein